MRGPSRGSMKSSSPHVGARLGIARFQLGQRRSHCTAQASLAEQVQSWLELDTDPESVKEVKELQAANDESLLDRFGSRLAFGTAGLRALDGPGFNRMNTITVKQTTQGLVRYLQQQQTTGWDLRCGEGSPNLLSGTEYLKKGIIVGYDGRTNSREYAAAVIDTITSQNIPVHVFADVVPTPLVAHAVSALGCAAGIMVTASHNPAGYNGYKVYYCNGCQIIPPHDAGIASMIEKNLQIWPEATAAQFEEYSHEVGADVVDSYFTYLQDELCFKRKENRTASPCVYTPLHGVGAQYVYRALQCMGLPAPLIVPEQAYPDPEFPTTPFPNPEEGEGVWQLAYDLGVTTPPTSLRRREFSGARLALANDPDADRLAASEWQAGETDGSGHWHAFTGNEIGILLASWLWEQKYKGRDNVQMLTTVVSSRMLSAMAKKEGFQTTETLTGFKWLGNWSNRLALEGSCVPFAYEEAIGFSLGELVRDKDGVSAAAVFAEMAQECYRKDSSVLERLHELYARYGVFHSIGGYVISNSTEVMERVFSDIRGSEEPSYPDTIAGLKVESVRDLGTGLDTSQPDRKAQLPWKRGDKFISFALEGGAVVTLRASGTEPKLKYYLEVQGDSRAAAAELAKKMEADVVGTLLQPEKYGLTASLA